MPHEPDHNIYADGNISVADQNAVLEIIHEQMVDPIDAANLNPTQNVLNQIDNIVHANVVNNGADQNLHQQNNLNQDLSY